VLTKLPSPIRIFFCRHCKDVTPVATDRHGDYCADCQYPIDGSSELSMVRSRSVGSSPVGGEHDPQSIVIKVFEAVG
jgi:hypothetical protein